MQFCCGGVRRCYLTDVKPLPLMKRPRNGRTNGYPTASVEQGEAGRRGYLRNGPRSSHIPSCRQIHRSNPPASRDMPSKPHPLHPSVLTSSPTHRNATNER